MREHVEIMDIPLDYKNSLLSQFEEWCSEHKPSAESVWFTTERKYSLENIFERDGDSEDYYSCY